MLDFVERPEEGFTLTGFGEHLVGGNAGVGLADVANHAAHEVEDVLEIAMILLRDGEVEGGFLAAVVVVLDPITEVAMDGGEVLLAVFGGLDGVVAEIFGHDGGIDDARLHGHEAEVGILHGLVGHGFDGLRFVVELTGILGVAAVVPVDGEVVVLTEFGRREAHALVAGLGYVVVARIVHDGGRSAVLAGEGGVAERIGGEGGRGGHVVFETEGVTYFVGHGISERFLENGGGQGVGANGGIDVGGLHEAPFIEEVFNVVVDDDRGVDDLAGGGVYPRGTHGILFGIGDVANAGVGEVVGIKLRIFLCGGEIAHLYDVLETNFLESLVPTEHAFADGLLPGDGEVGIDVEDDGLLGLNEAAGGIVRQLLGLETPTVGNIDVAGAVGGTVDVVFHRIEDADAGIGQARCHLLLGEEEEGVGDIDGGGGVALQKEDVHDRGAELVVLLDLDADVVVEGFELLDEGQSVVGCAFECEVAGLRGDDGDARVAGSHQ